MDHKLSLSIHSKRKCLQVEISQCQYKERPASVLWSLCLLYVCIFNLRVNNRILVPFENEWDDGELCSAAECCTNNPVKRGPRVLVQQRILNQCTQKMCVCLMMCNDSVLHSLAEIIKIIYIQLHLN